MSGPSLVVWDERLAEYDFGPGHPLDPIRLRLAMALAGDLGLLDSLGGPVAPAAEADLLRVHGPAYLEAVIAASSSPPVVNPALGLGSPDNPVFPGMHEASARVCGATLMAARAVASGDALHAVNLAGGLHHAMPDSASGFCVYNDIGVAIAWLLEQGFDRIAYIDVDVHHGDGVQAMFWDDPRVVTISIHESPRSLFPGSGWPSETGGAEGTAVNIALPAGTDDQGWLRAFHAVVPQVLEAFRPSIVVSQHGVDAHRDDPLAHLMLTLDGQRMSYEAIHRWAHAYAQGRWIAVGGGGYECVEVVPRAWAHLIGLIAGRPVDPLTAVPEQYLARVAALGRRSPELMTDGRTPWPRPFDQGFDPQDPVDGSVLATRAAVFPAWGLLADPDGWA